MLAKRADSNVNRATVFYGLILFFSFIAVPFAYFYYEEGDEDNSVVTRALSACRYASGLVILIIILLVVGFVANPGGRPNLSNPNAQYSIDKIFATENSTSKHARVALG